MRTYGAQITDQTEKILSLTKKYGDIVSAIEEAKDLSQLSCNELFVLF